MASLTISNFSHTALNVNDMKRSSEFFRDLLGFEQISETQITGGMGLSAGFLTPAGVTFELLQLNDSDGNPIAVDGSRDSVRIALSVANIEDAKAHFARAGVSVVHEMESAGIKMIFVIDPDGRTIELDEFPDKVTSFAELHGR